ncbi:hypothetical protein GCM10009620_19200 [Microbacterium thalassium]
MSRAAASIIIAVLAVTVLAADQFTKYLAIENLPPEEAVHVLGDFLVFYLVRNPGAAFSLGEGVTWLFTLALAAVAVIIVVLAVTRIRSRLWAVALGLLLGGALGNLTDRVFRDPGFPIGHVVDFIHTPWMMPAIYNVADIFIVSMMIGVALLVLIGIGFDGSRETRVADETADAEAAEPEASEADAAEPALESESAASGDADAHVADAAGDGAGDDPAERD